MEPSPSQPAVSSPAKPRLRRHLARILTIVAICYTLFAGYVTMFQEHLIFPGAYVPAPLHQTVPNSEGFRLPLPNGLVATGIFAPALRSTVTRAPTILYFYGNGDSLATSAGAIELFRSTGANILAIDYPGYGASTGKPSETNCYAAANALWDYALTRPEVDPDRIIVVGWSLGGAVAIDLVHTHPSARALFTISTFTTMGDMARRQMPFLPTSLMLRHHFLNMDKIPAIRCPIIIAHGDDDTMIPPSMALRLRDAATSATSVRHLPIPNAGHNDVLLQGQRHIKDALTTLLSTLQPTTLPTR